MDNLLILLLLVFGGVALMVILGERFAAPAEPERLRRVQCWILPLVGMALVLSLARYYWP